MGGRCKFVVSPVTSVSLGWQFGLDYGILLNTIHLQMASIGPGQCPLSFRYLDAVLLRLGFQNHSGLALNQNLPFVDGH
jgi:hypothetical protein